ncbi:MAG: polysaccharide biosynthesis C-terminal domain-containing protein [Paludibacter sp.]|jgi:O-antigen/teichoic acid export membrane protein|nr:polysaccharide biosynthesis C-terminal domain-containing protein [Paludibacter sp.]
MPEKQIKTLAKETAIYGISSILGKFINWLLVPLYTYVLASSADYGVVTNLYAWTALLLVILTYGMETGFFRFANDNAENSGAVYTTSLISIGITSILFAIVVMLFRHSFAAMLGYEKFPEYIAMLGVIVAIDAFASIPFAYLRFKKRPVKFAALKLLFVALNVAFNLFFLVACPAIAKTSPTLIDWFYRPDYGVGYVFVSNILSTAIQTLFLLPYIFAEKLDFRFTLLRRILRYSLPLLVLGIAGIMNQTLDKILYPHLVSGAKGAAELGIYGATSKLALIMLMFTQAFRYAYEPFIFAKNKDKNSVQAYADAMKFFVIFSLLIFLGMVLYIDVIKYAIAPEYWSGLGVVPIILVSFIFQGIFFNLSLWYKLSDRTMVGAIISIIGTIVIVAGNLWLVPRYGFYGCAWAEFACYGLIMLISYFWGRKVMPVPYNLKSIGFYLIVAIAIYIVSQNINYNSLITNLFLKSILLIAFLTLIVHQDLPLKNIPIINRFVKR